MSEGRAVSEMVSFVLVFSIIVASVGVLYVSGIGSLTEARESEQVKNAERAFVALATTFDDLQQGRAPARAGEIRLANGIIRQNDGSRLRVQVERSGAASPWNWTSGGAALTYEFDERRIRYDHGAVFRASDAGNVLVHEPAFHCSNGSAVVSTVRIESTETTSVSKQGSVFIVGRSHGSELLFPQDATPQAGNTTVRVQVSSSPTRAAWERYLDDAGWSKNGSWYECSADTAVVRRTAITVEFRV
ncbi:DUF7289 family protein [Halomicrococcus gelatinilyticus]|uniref:DUF7289 family protein n=1 Tax=Halomicrococcus gelatinilyticus TaxID=1702103 RepID=UPI002E102293